MFLWVTIMFSQTLGTALGEWAADPPGLGYRGGAVVFRALLALVIAVYFWTKMSRTTLFWEAFILTRPLGAVVGNFLDIQGPLRARISMGSCRASARHGQPRSRANLGMRLTSGLNVARKIAVALVCVLGAKVDAQPIEVRVEMRGQRVVVDVAATVAARPAEAWSLLTDYDHMARFVSALKSSSIVGREGNSLEVEQTGEATVGFMSFPFYSLRAVQLIPETEIHSQLIRGDFKSYEFSTRILDNGAATMIIHHGEYVPNRWVPPGLGPSLIKDQTAKQYAELVAEILARRRVELPQSKSALPLPPTQR